MNSIHIFSIASNPIKVGQILPLFRRCLFSVSLPLVFFAWILILIAHTFLNFSWAGLFWPRSRTRSWWWRWSTFSGWLRRGIFAGNRGKSTPFNLHGQKSLQWHFHWKKSTPKLCCLLLHRWKWEFFSISVKIAISSILPIRMFRWHQIQWKNLRSVSNYLFAFFSAARCCFLLALNGRLGANSDSNILL